MPRTVYHVIGRGSYFVASDDGREQRVLSGRPEARRVAREITGGPIHIVDIEAAEWDAKVKAWNATSDAHYLEPVIVTTPEQAAEAAKDLIAKGATSLTVRALTANETARKGVRRKALADALKAVGTGESLSPSTFNPSPSVEPDVLLPTSTSP